MKKHLNLSQRIHNATGSQAAENVKARHTYLHARCDNSTEWNELWTHSDECGWAHAFGCMKGFEQVWYGSVTSYDKLAMENWLEIIETYPELGGKDPRPLMEASVHTLVTDVIEVADDGMSARGSFITPGVIHSTLTAFGTKYCRVLWERYGADFVYEDGEWKYLNEQVCPDILTDLDVGDWAAEDYRRHTDPSAAPPPPVTAGNPPVTYPGPWHVPYTIFQLPQDDAPWPVPYKTMDEENRYNKPRNV